MFFFDIQITAAIIFFLKKTPEICFMKLKNTLLWKLFLSAIAVKKLGSYNSTLHICDTTPQNPIDLCWAPQQRPEFVGPCHLSGRRDSDSHQREWPSTRGKLDLKMGFLIKGF